MLIEHLRASAVRNLRDLDIQPGPGINLFVGDNGAGKTSLLECVCLLSRGRSFRTHQARPILADGSTELSVFARVRRDGAEHQLGMSRGSRGWRGRVDGNDASGVAELARQIPVLVFEPGSHELVEGAPEHRRRYLDWGVFHVEPRYGRTVQQYRKAVKQRNSALRQGSGEAAFAFDELVASLGEQIYQARGEYLDTLRVGAIDLALDLHGDLEGLDLSLVAGWDPSQSLLAALKDSRERDLAQGHTSRGPHRGDLAITLRRRSAAQYLSRGQQKVLGLALIMAQAEAFHVKQGFPPVMLLDDLASELDPLRQERALGHLARMGAQLMVTSLMEALPLPAEQPLQRFHVERGGVQAVV